MTDEERKLVEASIQGMYHSMERRVLGEALPSKDPALLLATIVLAMRKEMHRLRTDQELILRRLDAVLKIQADDHQLVNDHLGKKPPTGRDQPSVPARR